MGSADWMPRNLDRRVEIVFPVEDEGAKRKAKHILDVELADNLKAYYMNETGEYERLDKRGKKIIGSQDAFCEEAIAAAPKESRKKDDHTFEPRMSAEDAR